MTVDIINADCVDVLPEYAGKIDLIVTSPPYDDIRQYDGKSEFDFHAAAPLLVNALRDGGVLCWNVQDQQKQGGFTLTSFEQALRFRDLGLRCREKLISERPHPVVRSQGTYLRSTEHVFVFTKGVDITFNPIEDRPNDTARRREAGDPAGRTGDKRWSDQHRRVRYHEVQPFGKRTEIWRYSAGLGMTAPDALWAHKSHPALMPLLLAQDLIRSYSNEGDLVLDPYAGLGTTIYAAKKMLRNAIGIDINSDYCAGARIRCSQEVLT